MQLDPIHHDAEVPPFEQARSQIAARIAAGALPSGTRLPTVRALAGDLGVAVNTVARVYKELEADGLVVTEGRRGTFVTSTSTGAAVDEVVAAYVRGMPTPGADPGRGSAAGRAGWTGEVRRVRRRGGRRRHRRAPVPGRTAGVSSSRAALTWRRSARAGCGWTRRRACTAIVAPATDTAAELEWSRRHRGHPGREVAPGRAGAGRPARARAAGDPDHLRDQRRRHRGRPPCGGSGASTACA